MNNIIHWYNKLSWFYDLCTINDLPYRRAREYAIGRLELEKGDVVFDLFCGTGVNFRRILKHIGREGVVIGVDGSVGMLKQAKKKIEKYNINENQIKLVEADLEAINSDIILANIPMKRYPKVLITLGLSTLSNPAKCFDKLYDAFPVGTRFSILDGYCKKGTLSSSILNFIGAGNTKSDVCNKKVWELLKEKVSDYWEKTYHPFIFLKCYVVIASGIKS